MRTLSREHQPMFEFQTAVSNWRPVFESGNDDLGVFDCVSSSISNFMLSELNYRQGERSDAAGLYSDRVTYYPEIGERFNDLGVDGLDQSLPLLDDFINSDTFSSTNAEFNATLDDFKRELLDLLLDVEWKPADITSVIAVIDEVFDNIKEQPAANLLNYISSKISDLKDAKISVTRGSEENIPIWKIAELAVLFGMASWAVYACYCKSKGCSKKQQNKFNAVMAVALVTLGAC
jgi:hypothetical protein